MLPSVNTKPAINPVRFTTGVVIAYRLRPEENPTNPEREWRGRITRTVIGQAHSVDVVWVESLEEGYEGETEYVYLTQIVRIEKQASACLMNFDDRMGRSCP